MWKPQESDGPHVDRVYAQRLLKNTSAQISMN